MLDSIPIQLYTDLFNYLVFALIIIAVLESFSGKLFNPEIRGVNNIIGIIIVIVVIIYMGLRPVSSVFGDTQAYAISFHRLQLSDSQFHILNDGEWVFNTIMFWFAKNGNIHTFFLFCSTVYVGTLWWALVRIFKEDYLIPFIVAIGMFTFWSYGVNGVRNGMAASIIILAFTFRQNPVWLVILCFLGAGIHNSMYLTLAGGGVAFFAKDSKIYLSIWLACILISLISGNLFANMIAGSNLIEDDRFASYIAGDNTQSVFSNKGFRWDFLLYSSIPVAAGYYFIFKEKYTDIFYIWLFNIYLMTNAFWIIIIRASFSNRFAQISWFLMPLILIYPFFMKKFWNDQSVKIGYIVIISYSYTFYLTFIK